MAVSQPSVSRCIKYVTTILNTPEVFNAWVKFPSNIEQLQSVRNGYNMHYTVALPVLSLAE